MNPKTVFCPNMDCPARGQKDRGNIRVHDWDEERYICHVCKKTFTATKGTPFAGLKTEAATVELVVTLMAYGCPVPAIEKAFGFDERTVKKWWQRAGEHCEAVHEHLVASTPLDLGQVQADEVKVKTQKRAVWMAMVMMVSTRLWLGGAISPQRDKGLIVRIAIVQVVKQRTADGLSIQRRIVQDGQQLVQRLLTSTQNGGVINTAYIERLNATFRQRLVWMVRRTRHLAQQEATLQAGMYIVGCFYNFCDVHQSLRLKLWITEHTYRWVQRGALWALPWLPASPTMSGHPRNSSDSKSRRPLGRRRSAVANHPKRPSDSSKSGVYDSTLSCGPTRAC